MKIFDFINEITFNKTEWDSFDEVDKKLYNNFIINRFISMNVNFIDMVNIINKYDIPKKSHYNFYKDLIVKQKSYSKYIKNTTKSSNKEMIDLLCKYWECSSREAKENIQILEVDDIKSILKNFGKSDKEIKLLLK